MIEVVLPQLLEHVSDAMIVVRNDGAIAFANQLAANLLGYAENELLGKPLDTIVPVHLWQRFHESTANHLDPPLQPRMAGSVNLWALCKGGREIPIVISLSPLDTPDGVLVVASLRGVSVQQTVESDLRSDWAAAAQSRERLALETNCCREEINPIGSYEEFVGTSGALMQVVRQIDQVARTDANVLILGETGTGKELVARAIHTHSLRKDHPLITLNCAALPHNLIESELFGHEAGAFTGALARKIGRFALADGGTIFLDEIGELPIELQAKLLRVIENGIVWRLGSDTPTKVNVRVIAATNRNLVQAMQQAKFRPDLYFRLAVFPINVPPLRARSEDIPALVWHFVLQKQAKLGKQIEQITTTTMESLSAYSWPGNIRELENVVERALILTTGSTLRVEPLVEAVERQQSPVTVTSENMKDVEREHIRCVLEECHWRIKGKGAAAERLGMNPSTLRYRMSRLGLARPGILFP